MEKSERKERRDKDWVCRIGLQIKSCKQCLFDAFCTYEDNQNEQKTRDSSKAWMDN